MSTPLCSIIIPTYNHGKFIERSIRSALAQTYQNIEVIVVDDGSTDDTAERVQQFGNAIQYIRKKNTGRGDNRNVAIEASKGKYIQFLDSDDTIDKRKIEIQVPFLENGEDIASVYSDCSCTSPEGNELENVSYPLKDGEDALPILLKRTLFGIHACIVRRSVVVDVGMFDKDPLAQEDWDLWLKIALKGYKYKYVPGDLAHYDMAGSATVTNNMLMYKRIRHMLNKYENDPAFTKSDKGLVNKFTAYQNISLATRAYNNRWWKECRLRLSNAKKADPGMLDGQIRGLIPKTYFHQFVDFIRGRKKIKMV